MGDVEEHYLVRFAARFDGPGAWFSEMLARGFSVPTQMGHGLTLAMKHLKLTFPEAFRLLWGHGKIIVAGRSLIYDESARNLWEERPEAVPPAAATPPEPPLGPDVLAQVPPTAEMLLLDEIWRLDAGASPLKLLLLWEPTDETDKYLRRFLLDFGHRVLLAADRERAQCPN